MKKFKFICLLGFVMSLFLINNIKIAAAFPNSLGTISQAPGSYVEDSSSDYGMALKVPSQSSYSPAICTLYGEETPAGKGVTCTLNNDWDDKVRAGVAAIIIAAKPSLSSSSMTNAYFAAELAINQFLYEKNGANVDNEIRGSMDLSSSYKTLFDNYLSLANTAYNNYSTASLSLSSSSLTFTKSGSNYVSNTITVTSSTGSYNVNTNMGTISKDGNKFSVTVPESSLSTGTSNTITVTVSNSKTNYVARNYTCGSYQTLTPSYTEAVASNASKSASGTIARTRLIIKKVDSAGNLIAGAQIKVENADKSFSQTFETGTSEKVIDDIPYGEYTITEISSPKGYIKAKSSEKVTISSSELSRTVTLKNTKTRVEIIKTDSKTGEPLVGAKLQVQDKDGNKKDEWVTDGSAHIIEGLEIGTYYLVEISSPDGYVLNKKKVKFELTAENGSIKVAMENNQTKVEIIKTDSKTGKPLVGAKLQVQDKDGKKIEEWVTDGKTHVIEGLKLGTYYLVEISSPDGYALNKKKVKFVLTEENGSIKVEMKNSPTKVKISKISMVNSQLLPGATLQIEDEEGNIVKFCIDSKGNKNTECKWVSTDKEYEIDYFPKGTYYLVEISSPEGYELNKEKVKFEVNENLDIVEVEMKNNLEVDVPDTLDSRSALLLCIAMFDIAIGIGILTYVKKNKIQE